MKVLIANCDKPYYFISIYIKCNELIVLGILAHDNFSKRLSSLTNKVDMSVANRQIREWQIPKLTPLVKHVHSCVKTRLYIILHIVSPYSNFVHKTWDLSAGPSRVYRRHDIVIQKTEPNIGCWNAINFVNSNSAETTSFFLVNQLIKIDFWHAKAIFSYNEVRFYEELGYSFLRK